MEHDGGLMPVWPIGDQRVLAVLAIDPHCGRQVVVEILLTLFASIEPTRAEVA